MNHEGSVKCIHNIYFTVVKSVCSCGIVQSGELYKYLQILLTSWRQSSRGPLGWIEGGSIQYTRGSWRNWVCFPGAFMDKPVSSERCRENSKRQWSQTAKEDDPFERKEKILPLRMEQVLPERPQDLCLWWCSKQDRAKPSAAWSNFEDGLACTMRLD